MNSHSTKSVYKVADDEDEWTYLIKKDIEKFNRDKQENLLKTKINQHMLRQALDNQVIERQKQKQLDNEIEMRFHKTLIENIRKEELNQKESLDIAKKREMISRKVRIFYKKITFIYYTLKFETIFSI